MWFLRAQILLGAAAAVVRSSGHPHRNDQQKAQMTIYYETLCPYCEMLFDVSFRKIWEDDEFRERIDIDLVPFGNAKVIGRRHLSTGYHFWHTDTPNPTTMCQHDAPECLGNEIQTCAIDSLGMRQAATLVVCMAGTHSKGHSIEMAAYDCMQELGIDSNIIKQCLGSRRARRLVAGYGKRTRNRALNRSYVPWVVINGKHVELDDQHDLVRPLCTVLQEPKPAICGHVKPITGFILRARRGLVPRSGSKELAMVAAAAAAAAPEAIGLAALRPAREVCWDEFVALHRQSVDEGEEEEDDWDID